MKCSIVGLHLEITSEGESNYNAIVSWAFSYFSMDVVRIVSHFEHIKGVVYPIAKEDLWRLFRKGVFSEVSWVGVWNDYMDGSEESKLYSSVFSYEFGLSNYQYRVVRRALEDTVRMLDRSCNVGGNLYGS